MDMSFSAPSIVEEVVQCYVVSVVIAAWLIAMRQAFRDKLILLRLSA